MATKQRPRPTPPLRPTISAVVPTSYIPGRTGDVTVGDFIVEQIHAGVDPINAAGVVGVTPAEFQAWMREGVLVFSRLNAGAEWAKDFTPEQQDAAVFADRTIRAHATHVSRLTVISEQAATGKLPAKVTKRTKTVNGQVAEEIVTSETMLPDLDMIRWKLETLAPDVYGKKASLNITVTDLTDTDAVVDLVELRMREVAEALKGLIAAPAAIETTATEGEPDGQSSTES